MAEARRGAEERRCRSSSDRHRHAIAAVGDESEHHHATRLDLAHPETGLSRISASSISTRRRRIRRRCARPQSAFAICSRSWRCRRGSKRQARRDFISSFHSTARRASGRSQRFANAVGKVFVSSRARSSHAGVQQGRSPRANLRRYRKKRLQRHVCRRVHRAREAWRARIRAVHMGGG